MFIRNIFLFLLFSLLLSGCVLIINNKDTKIEKDYIQQEKKYFERSLVMKGLHNEKSLYS
jgi:uncharacterized protein YceK